MQSSRTTERTGKPGRFRLTTVGKMFASCEHPRITNPGCYAAHVVVTRLYSMLVLGILLEASMLCCWRSGDARCTGRVGDTMSTLKKHRKHRRKIYLDAALSVFI